MYFLLQIYLDLSPMIMSQSFGSWQSPDDCYQDILSKKVNKGNILILIQILPASRIQQWQAFVMGRTMVNGEHIGPRNRNSLGPVLPSLGVKLWSSLYFLIWEMDTTMLTLLKTECLGMLETTVPYKYELLLVSFGRLLFFCKVQGYLTILDVTKRNQFQHT